MNTTISIRGGRCKVRRDSAGCVERHSAPARPYTSRRPTAGGANAARIFPLSICLSDNSEREQTHRLPVIVRSRFASPFHAEHKSMERFTDVQKSFAGADRE